MSDGDLDKLAEKLAAKMAAKECQLTGRCMTFDSETVAAIKDWARMYRAGKTAALVCFVSGVVGAILVALWRGIVHSVGLK